MKIERLIAMLLILLQNKKVTATTLAERFNVSKRTIYRDITDLCLAGVPIVTSTGTDGGIMMDEGYKIDKTFFNESELQVIFAGLLGLSSVTIDNKIEMIIDKFKSKNTTFINHHIVVNLSSFYKDTLAPKIELLQQCIEQNQSVEFSYYSKAKEMQVVLNPYLIVYQWSSWYVYGCEKNTERFKLYKLNRILNLKSIEEYFEIVNFPKEDLDFNQFYTDEIKSVILFDASVKYRLIDEYGIDSFQIQGDKLRFEFPFTNDDYLISWVLGFGENAELIEPVEVRNKIQKMITKMSKKYE